ncbi:17412_t:CDS:2 [Dentiscutata erythropus]|uniref:17412_t:CDS:1 n=1 Tax=Dentiscutata erythropus TaxID=1348616 RepID=A0A9N9I917_9GLOM|nr:17412_t:CDS:2 [Dentiscutata erythropus]
MNESQSTYDPVNIINGEDNFILSIITTLLSGVLLSTRLYKRKTRLFVKGLLSPLEGFLLFTLIGGIYIEPRNYILRQSVEDWQWINIQLSVATYLAGVFRTIPRITIIQPTKESDHIQKSLWIPSLILIRYTYWSFFVIIIVVCQGSSIISGYFRMRSDKHLSDIFFTVRFLCYSFGCTSMLFGYGIYGRTLVKLTKRSFELIDETRRNNERIKWQLRKMQMFNQSAFSSFLFWSVATFFIAFCHDLVWSTLALSEIQIIMACPVTIVSYIVAMIVIAVSDLRNQDSNPDDVSIATYSNQFMRSQSAL